MELPLPADLGTLARNIGPIQSFELLAEQAVLEGSTHNGAVLGPQGAGAITRS